MAVDDGVGRAEEIGGANMRVVVVSCWKYRDCWEPFLALFRKYWPDFKGTPHLITDTVEAPFAKPLQTRYEFNIGQLGYSASWCEVVAAYCSTADEPFLLMQEDFLINTLVHCDLIAEAFDLLLCETIGAVRIYPSPGATEPSDHPHFGSVARHMNYRTSCQATIWKPVYLQAIAERFETPTAFEMSGSNWASSSRPEQVWATKRETQPWPIEYLCSAIARGKWTRDAIELCAREGIPLDLTLRPTA